MTEHRYVPLDTLMAGSELPRHKGRRPSSWFLPVFTLIGTLGIAAVFVTAVIVA